MVKSPSSNSFKAENHLSKRDLRYCFLLRLSLIFQCKKETELYSWNNSKQSFVRISFLASNLFSSQVFPSHQPNPNRKKIFHCFYLNFLPIFLTNSSSNAQQTLNFTLLFIFSLFFLSRKKHRLFGQDGLLELPPLLLHLHYSSFPTPRPPVSPRRPPTATLRH